MLVLSRKVGETIVVGSEIRVMVVDIRGDKVRIGIAAPREMPVHREEIARMIADERAGGAEGDIGGEG